MFLELFFISRFWVFLVDVGSSSGSFSSLKGIKKPGLWFPGSVLVILVFSLMFLMLFIINRF